MVNNNNKNIGKILAYPVSEINVAVVVMVWNDKFVDRFWPTYKKFRAGMDHKLLLVRNMGGGTKRLDGLLDEIKKQYEVCNVENFISRALQYGYEKLRNKYNYIFFTSDSVWINGDNWLLHSFLSLYATGAGMAAHQYRNGNLRQDWWGAKTEVLDKLDWGTAETFQEWYELGRSHEWRDLCFSRQCQNLGYNIVQIGTKGIETVIGGDYEYILEHLEDVPKEVWEQEPPNYPVLKVELIKRLKDKDFDTIIKALSFFPEEELDSDILNMKATALFQTGKIVKAAEVWLKALVLSPDRDDLRKNLKIAQNIDREMLLDTASWLYRKGRLMDSKECFALLLRRQANDVEAGLKIIIIENGVREVVDFRNLLEKAYPKDYLSSNSSVIERICGDIELLKDDFAAATNYYHESLKSNPKDFRALKGLGEAHLGLNKPKVALDYLKRATVLLIHSPLLYYSIGEAWEQLGETKKAFRCYQKTLSLMPDNVDAVHKLRSFIPVFELARLKYPDLVKT